MGARNVDCLFRALHRKEDFRCRNCTIQSERQLTRSITDCLRELRFPSLKDDRLVRWEGVRLPGSLRRCAEISSLDKKTRIAGWRPPREPCNRQQRDFFRTWEYYVTIWTKIGAPRVAGEAPKEKPLSWHLIAEEVRRPTTPWTTKASFSNYARKFRS